MAAEDVIFALASGQGRAGVAVLRLSGAGADEALTALGVDPLPAPRRAALRRLSDPEDGGLLDQALALRFPAPASFTGEDVVELHVHGGPAVIDGISHVLAGLPGFRPAEPGEFSRRAFRNGKLDLAEAEGLADLIDADSAAGRRQAIWQMTGGLSAIYQAWRQRLIDVSALAEATLDFADEPIPEDLEQRIDADISAIRNDLAQHLGANDVAERLNDGLRVVLSGAPNVGKSSLLNALAKREAAIVTALPGTTRDVLEVRLTLSGYPVTLYDTAGLRETADPIEQEGVRRARAAAEAADIVIDVQTLDACSEAPSLGSKEDRILFWNKADLAAPPALPASGIVGSAATGAGLQELKSALTAAAKSAIDGAPPPAITRARHRAALTDAVEALDRALAAPAPELLAEDLRSAAMALGRVIGVVDVEDVLDRVFASFCIGK